MSIRAFIQLIRNFFHRRHTPPGAASPTQPGAASASEPSPTTPHQAPSTPHQAPSTPHQAPSTPQPRLRQLHIWCESPDGTRHDALLAKIRWPRERLFVHANDSERATTTTRFGRHVHALHFAYAPWNNTSLTLSGRQQLVDLAITRARKLNATAMSIDHETHFIMWGPAFLQYISDSCAAAGLPLIHVPAVGLRHLLNTQTRDDWVWTRPDRFNMSEQAVAAFLNVNTATSLQWYYGPDADVFIEGANRCRRLGFTRPIIPLMEGRGRISPIQQVALAETLWSHFGSIGLFNPSAVAPGLVETLNRLAKE
jgi:hypothetical protein